MSDSAGPQCFDFGDFTLDRHRRLVTRAGGEPIDITAKAFDALVYFLEHPGVVIDRSTLLDVLWPDTVVEENNLSQAVAALRRALGAGYIVTVKRKGYQFVADVRPGTRASAGVSERVPRAQSFRGRTLGYLAGAAALIAFGLLVFYRSGPTSDSSGIGPGALPRIAVLPCDNLSPAPADAYLAQSMQLEIMDQLGKLEGLRVISRPSVMQFADNRPSIPEIAAALGARAVMDCAVRQAGGSIVVTAQLYDPVTDSQLWSGTYPGAMEDVNVLVAMQADIAASVAESLAVEPSAGELRRLEKPGTTSYEAYASFLEARQALGGSSYGSGYASEAFHKYINQAINADPAFALAWSYRAFAHLVRATDAMTALRTKGDSGSLPQAADREQLDLARQDASKALALDPGIGRAHAALGAVERISGDVTASRVHFERAVASSANDAEVLSFVAGFHLRDGRGDSALELLQRVGRLSPIEHDVALLFYLAGDRGTAREILRRVVERNPAHEAARSLLGLISAIEGDVAAAKAELRTREGLRRQNGDGASGYPSQEYLCALAYAYHRIGLDEDANRLAQQFLKAVEHTPALSVHWNWTMLYLALGDSDRAYEAAVELAGNPLPPFVSIELEFVLNALNDPVLDEPRFVELRRKLGEAER